MKVNVKITKLIINTAGNGHSNCPIALALNNIEGLSSAFVMGYTYSLNYTKGTDYRVQTDGRLTKPMIKFVQSWDVTPQAYRHKIGPRTFKMDIPTP